MICLSCGVEAATVFGVLGATGSAVTFIQFIQSLYIQSKLTYTHSCTRTQTQKITNLNSVNCILNNTLRTHILCYMQMHSFKNTKTTHTHVNKERVREGTNGKEIMKVIVFFSKTCSLFRKHHLSLTFIHKYTFIHGLRHTHRWISACLRKGECETEVHVCYYFIIRSANAVRSQIHTIVCAHTACVL